MKKPTKVVVIAIFLMLFVACGSNNASSKSKINQNSKSINTTKSTEETSINQGTANVNGKTNNITMKIGDTVITATLDNSQTTQDFLKTLPRKMTMTRYGDREYYGKVGKTFSEDGEKIEDFKNGDVTYYALGGSLAIFFNNEENSNQSGLTRMGRITSDLKALNNLDQKVEMLIELSN